MNLRLTEKFLWDIYELIDKKDKFLDSLWLTRRYGFKGFQESIWPGMHGIRDAYWEKYEDERKRKNFTRLIRYLKNQGYLNIKDLKNRQAVMITPKGMEKLFKTRIKAEKMRQRSDRKWQMILFDIPETRRQDRDRLRQQLKYLGYKKLQRSVWVCPYNVLELTQQLIKNYKLDRFARLLLVEEIKI